MNKVSKPSKKPIDKYIAKIKAEAAAQNKTPMIYMSEQSDGLRQIFIHLLKKNMKKNIEELENIQSIHE
jgi:uncharacterized protein YnzC (UPF0291/DUF896 family)